MSQGLEELVNIKTDSGKTLEKAVEKKDFRVLVTYPNYSMMLTPSYAVGLFTAILKGKGYNVDLFDCTPYMAGYEANEEPNSVVLANKLMAARKFDALSILGPPKKDLLGDFGRKINDFKPHAVIFSTVVEDTWPQTKDLLEVLSNYPQVKSIVGGVYTTMLSRYPEHKVIADPHVQCIGEGEGEHTIVDFCESVRNGIPPTRIPGTRAKENGQVIRNPPRSLVNVNDVIPDFSLFDGRRFWRPLGKKVWKAIPIETYRGCPYTCTFCNSPAQVVFAREREQGNFMRRKSMQTLRKEITTLMEKYGSNNLDENFLYINDDAFMARPKKEIDEFVEMYEDIRIPFWFQTRFEDIDEQRLANLKEVGCYRISFGLEHGNEEYRKKRLRRNPTNKLILEKAKIVSKVGIPYSLNVIIGLPYETRDLVFDTIRVSKEIGAFDSIAPNIFTPYHGTELRDRAIEEGWLDPKAQTNSFVGGSILRMPKPYLQPDEMLRLQRVFNLYVQMPESRWPEIREVENSLGTEEGDKLFKKLSGEFYQKKYGMTERERMLTYSG
jgi:radical SAM superfamily enzyme YgiQ (UPF0313 family)